MLSLNYRTRGDQNYSHIVIPWPYQSTVWFVVGPFQMVRRALDFVATRKVLLEKKIDM